MEMLGRRALWEVGLNYGHGTGHGVGNYFGVHECKISALICSRFDKLMVMDSKVWNFLNHFWTFGMQVKKQNLSAALL